MLVSVHTAQSSAASRSKMDDGHSHRSTEFAASSLVRVKYWHKVSRSLEEDHCFFNVTQCRIEKKTEEFIVRH